MGPLARGGVGMTACPLFIELCAGTAAMSLRLHRARARPPVSRMGAKTGYADVLLGLMGLAPGQGARDGTRYLWCEPDPGVRLLLEAYRDAGLARAAADIIRGWAGEDPRALWERLRAEGPPRGLPADLCLRWLSYGQDPDRGFRATAGGTWPDRPPEVGSVAERTEGLPCLPAEVHPDARAVEPREVARWALLGEWAFRRGEPGSGPAGETRWADGPWRNAAGEVVATRVGWTAEAMSGRWGLPTLSADIAPDARTIDPGPRLPAGTWVFIDPPYSDVPPMVPPMCAAERLPLAGCGRQEGDAALRAVGLDHLREPVGHLRVAILEVLRAAGVQAQVLDAVVERVVIDVVDDFVWSQFAAKMKLHHKSVLHDAPAVVHHLPVPVLEPSLALACAADRCLGLDFGGDLRQFALRCQAQPGAAAQFTEAGAWAGCALSSRRTPWAREDSSADLARDLERHCLLRLRVRLDTNTRLNVPGRKTTGYAADLPRAEVVALARRWAAAGALVMVCEQEPIPELLADGWGYRDIAHARKGQARTFSRQSREVVTMNRAPVHVPAEQVGLFGGAR